MAKSNSTAAVATKSLALPMESVANVLTFLSWQQMVQGTYPMAEERGKVEAGLSCILDWCAASLRAEVAHG